MPPANEPYGPCSATRVQVYGATQGFPSAAARCSGPVSLPTMMSEVASNAASWGSVVLPVKSRVGPGSERITSSDAAVSSVVPMKRYDAFELLKSSAKCPGGQRFVTHLAPTATAM